MRDESIAGGENMLILHHISRFSSELKLLIKQLLFFISPATPAFHSTPDMSDMADTSEEASLWSLWSFLLLSVEEEGGGAGSRWEKEEEEEGTWGNK